MTHPPSFFSLLHYPRVQDTIGRFYCVSLKRANDIIGMTTEELVIKAKLGTDAS